MTPDDIDRVFGRGRLRMVTGDHVEVFREESQPGERRRYTKRFLATASGDFRQWTEREWRILARLVGHGIAPVPDVVQYDRGAVGRPALVQTYDAGITVDHWGTLLPVERDGVVLRHVFEDCAHWWALARHCLIALDAIHEIQLVHLDLKADNVCIPASPVDFDPHALAAQLSPRFDQIALIDFAFSLVSGEKLGSALPIARQTDYEYQSPRLLEALDAGRRGDLLPTRQLDWRCDVYSLAAMLRRYLPDPEGPHLAGWTVARHGQARALVRRLLEAHDAELPLRRPHAELIALATQPLDDANLAESLENGWELAFGTNLACHPTPTPVTRIAMPVPALAAIAPLHLQAETVAAADVVAPARRLAWLGGLVSMAALGLPLLGDTGLAQRAAPRAFDTAPERVASAAANMTPPLVVRAVPAARAIEVAAASSAAAAATADPAPGPAGAVSTGPTPSTPEATSTAHASSVVAATTMAGTPSTAAAAANAPAASAAATPATGDRASPVAADIAAAPLAPRALTPNGGEPATARVHSASTQPSAGAAVRAAPAPASRSARVASAPAARATPRAVSKPAPTATAAARARPTARIAAVPPPRSKVLPLAHGFDPKRRLAELRAAAAVSASTPVPAATVPLAAAAAVVPVAVAGRSTAIAPAQAGTSSAAAPAPAAVPSVLPMPIAMAAEARPSASQRDFAERADEVMAIHLPRVAQRAERLVMRVLQAAADDADGSLEDDIRAAASAIRLTPGDPALEPGISSADARQLNAAARAAFQRRGGFYDALELQTRAFGANPLNAEVAGNLAILRLRQQPVDVDAVRQLALHALTTYDVRYLYGRIEDWTTLAIANALSGRDRDARNAWFVTLALDADPQRQCRAAINAYAMYGERLRVPVEAMLQRVRAAGRSDASPLCEWPPYWIAARRPR